MIKNIVVREYARLTTDEVENSLDRACISASAFDWLCKINASFTKAGSTLVQVEGRRWLKLDSYVGVVETPCGTRIEILPKNTDRTDCLDESRQLLRKMLQRALKLPTRELGPTSISDFKSPLTEWVIGQFLAHLDHLIKRGVRFDYRRVEEEQSYLRGQLNVVAQLRQPPGRQHHFQIRHDLFSADRAENRLLQNALHLVCKTTQHPANWRLAHELREQFNEVPLSRDLKADFKAWRTDRLMTHYQPIRPWCELILRQQMPMAVAGKWHGISLLFPMEKLFEHYVGAWLKSALAPGAQIENQARRHHLCEQGGEKMFELRPDFLITKAEKTWVLDTKWKLLNASDRGNKYGLRQSDFYQMYAYGKTYLGVSGDMMLIYPKRAAFQEALVPFEFGGVTLQVVPFDLLNDQLVGVRGDWERAPS
ncbi:McrC family protein [Pseudomonas sp. KU26590]|uniref:McrC family protein n=1 Tax=Pseudomonas sp. KU26590 TaxID=2991051 RepID=UPI00223CA72E|nr:McrC family protein [Pseudomonas sp. KU26590]UZJ61777.1 McrC family protein [Pseudomonas sp. KU26590]